MRRRETVLLGLAISSAAVVAASCALNAGAIVYVVADSGTSTGGDSSVVTLPDGAVISPDGSIVTPDGGPLGKCAPDQVDIDAGFCIDSHEVTNAQYVAFLEATQGDAGNDFAPCVGVSPDPSIGYEILTDLNHPVRGVTWCSARSYCEWSGRRLCGSVADGGEVNESNNDYKDAAASEWFYACSQNGANAYPYGQNYDAGACNLSDFKEGGVVDVATLPNCVGGYSGIHDMSGNVSEWDNSCGDDTTAGAQCRVRGGSFNTDYVSGRCDDQTTANRNSNDYPTARYGIRCCSNEK